MTRWTAQEQECIAILRERLKEQLADSPQFPEVVGDRKLVRFLRGHNHDLEKVYGMMRNYLQWRKDNKVNEIRTNIVERGFDHPLRFPKGEIILKLIPQLVVLPEALDKTGSPICVEQYNFVPSEVFKYITIEDYILFVMYSLEYRSLIVEQLSEHREQAYLAGLTPEERLELEKPESKPYGVLVNICVIRDLNGVGFTHLSSQGIDIIKTVVTLASDNYPELMRKCFMINTPFVFNAVWYIIKGLLAARTLAKVSVRGTGYMDELLQEIDYESLPAMVGGGYQGYVAYTSFPFDLAYFVPPGTAVSVPTAVAVAADGSDGGGGSDGGNFSTVAAFTLGAAGQETKAASAPPPPSLAAPALEGNAPSSESDSTIGKAVEQALLPNDTHNEGDPLPTQPNISTEIHMRLLAPASRDTSNTVSSERDGEREGMDLISMRTSGY